MPLPALESSPIAKTGRAAQPRATAREFARNAPGLGLIILTSGFVIMSLTDGVAKFLAAEVSAGEIAWGRFLFQCVLAVPFVVAATGWRSLVPDRLLGNSMRGILLGGGSALFYVGLKKIPLADSAAIFFIQPFVLTILSALFEGEKVGWRRWSATAVGFGGALLVIQPSFSVFGPYALFPAGSAVCFAFYMLLNRRLRDSGSAMSMQTFASLTGMVTAAILLVLGNFAGATDFAITAPTLPQWGILAAIGASAALGHYLMIVAFHYATPAVLAPTQYVQIISATVFGYFVFGDFPDLSKWIGIAIIVACGIYVFHRETRVNAKV
jgi:drug/metabolite transporter (DMT)-like permease